jgi:hypothetical protein
MARPRTGDTDASASDGRSTFHLVTTIADDIKLLVTKEIELARKEIVGALTAKAVAVGAFAVAAFVALLALIFGIQTAVAGLDNVLRPWASRLIVTGALIVLAGAAAMFGVSRMKKPVTPKETKRTLKEGEEWARAQLRR